MENKNIDENWKENVQKEKEKVNIDPKKEAAGTPEANFATFIASMAMEAMIFLGQIQNPVTKKTEESMPQAKYIIDTIAIIKEKTKGNLSAEEANSIDGILYELRSKYVAKG